MTRKDFLRSVLGVGVGAAGIAALSACGDDGGSSTPDGSVAGCASAPSTLVQSNHGHTLMVPFADVTAATNKTYDITGSADHSHNVTITAQQFTQLAAGQTLNITSTSGGAHTHTVTVMCG